VEFAVRIHDLTEADRRPDGPLAAARRDLYQTIVSVSDLDLSQPLSQMMDHIERDFTFQPHLGRFHDCLHRISLSPALAPGLANRRTASMSGDSNIRPSIGVVLTVLRFLAEGHVPPGYLLSLGRRAVRD
jgi:hypothetical protein